MQGIELSECEKLASVEAHTVQYMRRKEVDMKLSLVVNTIKSPKAQLIMEQLGMAKFVFVNQLTPKFHGLSLP